MIYSLVYSRSARYFHCFIVYILIPYASELSYDYIMVRFLITDAL